MDEIANGMNPDQSSQAEETYKLGQPADRDNRIHPQDLVQEQVIPYAYPIVDAYLAHGNISTWVDHFGYSMQRQQTSSGSAKYFFSSRANKRYSLLATLTIWMVSDRLTNLKFEINRQLYEQKHSFIAKVLIANILSLLQTHLQSDQIAKVLRTQQPSISIEELISAARYLKEQEQQKRGRPPEDYNEWAWQEIQQGRDMDDILPEYLQRANIDPSDKVKVKEGKDQLRKARDRRTKRR